MELTELPEHLLVLGGGYIGLEFGQMFRRFGSQVTVVHSGDRLLNREDPDVAEELQRHSKPKACGSFSTRTRLACSPLVALRKRVLRISQRGGRR